MIWEQCSNLIRTKITADDSSGFLIAECPANMPDAIKHARLIAAAPDLLEACRIALPYLGDVLFADDPDYTAVHNAIAKATGERP